MKSQKIFLLSIVVLVIVALSGCTRIGPGHAGIEINAAGSDKGVSEQTARTGWFFYNPINTTIVEYQTAQRQEKWTHTENEGKAGNTEVTFTNAQSMVISADVAIAFSLDPARVPAFYVKFLATSEDDLDVKFTNGFLRNAVRNCLNDWAGKYDIKQIMGDNAEFLKKTQDCIQAAVEPWGVHIDQFGLIGAPRPPQVVVDSINLKSQAEQIATQKQIELTQVQAEAAKTVAQAEGNAKAQVTLATGEAEANRIRNQSITPNILAMRALDNQRDMIGHLQPGMLPSTLVLGGHGTDSVPGLLFQVPAK